MTDDTGRDAVLLRLFKAPQQTIKRLADAMHEIQVMGDPDSRQQVIARVQGWNRGFNPVRDKVDNVEIVNLIEACGADDKSFDLLLEAIETVAPDDPDVGKFKRLADELLPRSALTKGELQELVGLGCDTLIKADQLAGRIQRTLLGHGQAEPGDFQPRNVREAALFLLDHPQGREEGVSRLLGFVEWLAKVAFTMAEDQLMAQQLRDWIERVCDAHGLPPPASSAGAGYPQTDLAAGKGTDGTPDPADGTAEQPDTHSVGPPEAASPDSNEHGVNGQGKSKYFIGEEDGVFREALNPHERSLRELVTALQDIKPVIFRQSGLKGELLRTAQRALLSVNPLIEAVGEAARQENQSQRRVDLQDLAKNLRDDRDAVLQRLSELSATTSERSARRPCDDLTKAADRFLADGLQAVRCVT